MKKTVTGTTIGVDPLGRFRIRLNNERELFGVFLAAHAIPDALDFLHAGVGCKPKTQRQLAGHDRVRDAQKKHVWTDVSDMHLIKGSTDRLRDMILETVKRRGAPGLVLITTSTAMEMTGVDVKPVLADLRKRLACPVAYIPTPGFEGDMYSGYAKVVKAVMEIVPWRVSPVERKSVNVVGYLFDRYEQDHAANLQEIRRLISGLGLTLGAVVLSGASVRDLKAARSSGVNLFLPYAGGLADWAKVHTGRPSVVAELPVGLRGTAAFLRKVGRAGGVPDASVNEFIEKAEARVRQLLKPAIAGLAGLRVAVLADTPAAAGLCSMVHDLGATATLVGLLDRTLGGAAAFDDCLTGLGASRAAPPVVLEDPSAEDVRLALDSIVGPEKKAPVDLLIAPDLPLGEALMKIPRLEIGFPSNRRHAIYPMASFGYNGVLALAQRMLDAAAGVH